MFRAVALFAIFIGLESAASGQEKRGNVGMLGAPRDFRQVIERAKSEVFPALVYVKPIQEEFSSGERRKQEVFGSGFIISPDGLVVTNSHVAERAIKINCVLYSKEQFEAEVVGIDIETDLAVLRLKLPVGHEALPFGEFADSDQIKEGEFVMAMGSPFGFARSISLGIVSNTRRYLGFRGRYQYNTWLQTDAAINVGNSGGPLVNTDGKIVGINTLMVFMAENVGFAIPASVAKEVVAKLRKDGKIVRSWSGLSLQARKDFHTNTFADSDQGVLIAGVEDGSPAAKALLKAGDILLSVNGQELKGEYAEDLPATRRALADLPVGEDAVFAARRGGKEFTVVLKPALKGNVKGEGFDCARWNMTVKEINKFEDPDIHFYRREGTFVEGMKQPGNAANSGLKKGDILLKVDGREIKSLAGLREVYEGLTSDEAREKKALVEVLRGGYRVWVVLDYGKDYQRED